MTSDRVAVTYWPNQSSPAGNIGDRYAVKGFLRHEIYREVTATRCTPNREVGGFVHLFTVSDAAAVAGADQREVKT